MVSVGELLELADRQARDLLHEAPYRDGKAMLRAWGEVVDAAGQLWRAIPARGRDTAAPVRPVGVMDQLEAGVLALTRRVRTGRSVDGDLEAIGGLFTRAAAAVEDSGVSSIRTEAAARDAFAARVSIMHTLYLTGHAVSLGLRRIEPLDPAGTARLRAGVDAATDLALSYHQGAYPDALDHVHRDWIDPDRLGQAVSTWALTTDRVLAGPVTGRDVETVVGTALVTTAHARVLWRIAHESGHADAVQFRTRLGPALDASTQAWARLHGMLRPLVHPTERPTQELLTLSTDLRCALGQLASDRLAVGPQSSLAALVDLSETTGALRRFHASAAGVAARVQEVVQRGEVSVNAVAASRAIRTVHCRRLESTSRRTPHSEGSTAWYEPPRQALARLTSHSRGPGTSSGHSRSRCPWSTRWRSLNSPPSNSCLWVRSWRPPASSERSPPGSSPISVHGNSQ